MLPGKLMWLFHSVVFVATASVIGAFITFLSTSLPHVAIDQRLLTTSGLQLPGIGANHHQHDLKMSEGLPDPHHKMLVVFNKITSEVEKDIKPRPQPKLRVYNTRPNSVNQEEEKRRGNVDTVSLHALSAVKKSQLDALSYSNNKSDAADDHQNEKQKVLNLQSTEESKQNTLDINESDGSPPNAIVNEQIPIAIRQLKSDAMESISKIRGHVLAVNFYEQQTMASRNLFQLQCWAKHLDLVVVKPVMKDSFLRTPLDERTQNNLLKFEDFYDLSDWKSNTEKANFAPLVEWSKFIAHAPKNVILVQFNHPSVSLLKARQKSGESVIHARVGERYKTGCESGKWPSDTEVAFLKSKGFQTVRTVCFNFYYGDQLTLEEFDSHLLGGLPPHNVTIVLDMWRGLGTGQRILIKDTCTAVFPIQEYIGLSDRLLKDAETYINTYLNGGPYIAVMGRFEMTLLTIHKKVPVLPYCLKETLAALEGLRHEAQLDTSFLSVDIGKYGSKKWRSNINSELSNAFKMFFQGVYKDLSIAEWEFGFENVTHIKDAGYIGLLQKAMVTRAKCILFVGGGAFQRHALHLYADLHPDKRIIRILSQTGTPLAPIWDRVLQLLLQSLLECPHLKGIPAVSGSSSTTHTSTHSLADSRSSSMTTWGDVSELWSLSMQELAAVLVSNRSEIQYIVANPAFQKFAEMLPTIFDHQKDNAELETIATVVCSLLEACSLTNTVCVGDQQLQI